MLKKITSNLSFNVIVFNGFITNKNTILFLAIAKLFFGQVSAMDKALVKDLKEQEQVSGVLTPLLSTYQFKQLFVSLSTTSSNVFPLVFDHSLHENLIINYQLEGNCIAKLVHIDKMTRFESQDTKNYDFLLQSILKTDALTVATQGSFTFQKPVKTQSASLTCKSVEFLDKFSSKKDLILDMNYCDNSGNVTCADMFFRGKQFNVLSGSTLDIQERVREE